MKKNFKPVSSNVIEVIYDNENSELDIKFKNEKVYKYHNVPESIYESLIAAESVGSFVARKIVGQYNTKKQDQNSIDEKNHML